MIWTWLLTFLLALFNIIFSFMGYVNTLPTIGTFDLDGTMVSGVASFKEFMSIFPPLQTVFTAFMYYLTFKTLMLTLRLLRIIR